jgi:hypothetical protein
MIDYEGFLPFFLVIETSIYPLKTLVWWCQLGNGKTHGPWKAIKIVIQNAKFASLICDEVTSMDNANWASVHGYIM